MIGETRRNRPETYRTIPHLQPNRKRKRYAEPHDSRLKTSISHIPHLALSALNFGGAALKLNPQMAYLQ